MNFKSFKNLSEDIRSNLHALHAEDIDLVVGVPRSGMIPAYMIGLYLNVDVIDLGGLVNNSELKAGYTRKKKTNIQRAHDANKILIVDDSICSGLSMAKTIEQIPEDIFSKCMTLAVYSNTSKRNDVDLLFVHLPMPRVFEWNVFHRDLLAASCVDIDGVLCLDPTEVQNDDDVQYLDFLRNAKPLILPSYKIHSLVTNRLEKYRAETEEWLLSNNIEYENLIMLDLASKEERVRLQANTWHKLDYYKKNNSLVFFIESDINQALIIMKGSGKPVYCVDRNVMLQPGMALSLIKSPVTFLVRIKSLVRSIVPSSVLIFIKPFYHRLFR